MLKSVKHMKKLLFFLLLLPFISHAQPDYKKDIYIKEKRCVDFRNTLVDYDCKVIGNRIYATSQAYKLGGTGADAKLIIMNKNFDTIKTKIFGGTGDDILYHINVLPNGNILLSGHSGSDDGDVNGPAGRSVQMWLLEIDTNGNKIKSRTFGGTQGSTYSSAIVSKNGFIYLTGGTLANDYEFTHPKIGSLFNKDILLAKLDTAFNIIWVKIPSTLRDDSGCRVREVEDNKFLFSLHTEDTAQSVAGSLSKGDYDLVLYKLNDDGSEIWKKRYGGSNYEGISSIIYDSLNKYYYLIGASNSIDGDMSYTTNNFPGAVNNIWLLKLDTLGNVIHSKTYGSKLQGPSFITTTFYKNEIYISANTYQDNADFAFINYPLNDTLDNCWVGLFDTSANLIGKMGIKSNFTIKITNLLEVDNNLYGLGVSGDLMATVPNTFACDTTKTFYFILNLGQAPLGTKYYENENEANLFILYPNPTDNELSIKINEAYKGEKYSLDIYTLDGKKIRNEKGKVNVEPFKINTSNYSRGKYLIQLKLDQKKESKTFIKN